MRRYLERLFARAQPGGQDFDVHHVVEIEGGWETGLYAFDVTYLEGRVRQERRLVARFYHDPGGAAQAAREAAILHRLAVAGVRVPLVEIVDAQPSAHGAAIVVMERIEGAVFEDAMGEAGIDQMAAGLVAIHRLSIESVFDAEVQPFSHPAFVEPSLDGITRVADRSGLDGFRPLVEWLRGSRPAVEETNVLHGDYHPGNLVLDNHGGEPAIVDWSFASIGDYRLDLAWAALWTDAAAGDEARAGLLSAYETAAGACIEDFAFFEALKLGARLATLSLWLDPAIEPPIPKIDEAALRGGYRSTVETVYGRYREVTGLRLEWAEQL